MSRIKKVWFMTGRLTTFPCITPDEWEFLASNEWGIAIPLNVVALSSPSEWDRAEKLYNEHSQQILDNGVDLWLGVEAPLAYNDSVWQFYDGGAGAYSMEIWYDLTADDWEGYYGETLDYIEGLYPDLTGYYWEESFLSCFDWFCDRTEKQLMHTMGASQYNYPTPDFASINHDDFPTIYPRIQWGVDEISHRCDKVDSMLFQDFYVRNVTDMTGDIAVGNYVHTNYPSTGWGTNTGIDETGVSGFWNIGTPWEGENIWERQNNNMLAKMQQILTAVGANYDVFNYMFLLSPTGHTLLETLEPLDRLLKESPIYSQDTKQTGRKAHYKTPSICGYNPQDTFANTGNELILIKNYDCSGATHDITVTSTDTLTHADYTFHLSTDNSTILGPYPLDKYGVLPTISYDNTNLNVSVLKVSDL